MFLISCHTEQEKNKSGLKMFLPKASPEIERMYNIGIFTDKIK